MQANSLGHVSVPTPGTPVHVSATTVWCKRIRFSDPVGESGPKYVGVAGLVKSTGAGLIREIWPVGESGGINDDYYEVEAIDDRDLLNLADYWIDAANENEGLIIAYWTPGTPDQLKD